MARKGTRQKNGVDHPSVNTKRKGSETGNAPKGKPTESKTPAAGKLQDNNHPEIISEGKGTGVDEKYREKSEKFVNTEKTWMDTVGTSEHLSSSWSHPGDDIEAASPAKISDGDERRTLPDCDGCEKDIKDLLHAMLNGHMKKLVENVNLSENVIVRNMKMSAQNVLTVASEWIEAQRPLYIYLKSHMLHACNYALTKAKLVYPEVLKWLVQFGNIMLLLLIIWLDCTLRGVDSLLRVGTTSFFSIVWCGIFSVMTMVGISKFLLATTVAALIGLFVGLSVALLVLAILGAFFLWLYGSFWTTALVVIVAGIAFLLRRERIALLIATTYSAYSAWTYVGWLGLLLALNLSFISSDALIYFLRNHINQSQGPNKRSEQAGEMHGQQGNTPFSEFSPGLSTDRSPGTPSTSGTNSEMTSEDEVVRLLNCPDHYSALGLSRYENIDSTFLKKEYRKKAMLVHPDKNQGNEKAAEAFKKLQNAYEVLLDSLKRKEYDDELRREELLDYFHRFRTASQKNEGHGFFNSGFTRSDTDGEDPFRDSRRIACKKCNNFHVWLHTSKSKSQARWCQDCKEFHQAKDGDGWVEQSLEPLFFGLLQRVNAPIAYVCADSKIYDATEWYICQGMRCPANTHKPSFHVNTSVASKHNSGKGSGSGQKSGRGPPSGMEEMTEEEFFEWLQNAVQAGIFDNFGGNPDGDGASPRGGNGAKPGGSNGSGGKRKKKGKKQW